MFLKRGFSKAIFKANITAISLSLLLKPVALQAAESPEVAAGSVAESATASNAEQQRREFDFPRWPERKQINRKEIPPAPPGPYMSSALSDFSAAGPAFSRALNKPAIRMNPSEMPMKAFSPDIPWPSSLDAPQRWKPENGYHFVEPAVNKRHYPMMSFQGPVPQSFNRSNGYDRRPVMNWPGVRVPAMPSRSSPPAMRPAAPVRGVSQPRPYRGRADVSSPDNASRNSKPVRNTGHSNGRSHVPMNQAMYNPADQTRHPAYRAPAPSSARP